MHTVWHGEWEFSAGHLCKSIRYERIEWNCSLFLLGFSSGISTVVSEYRNKSSISDYSIAGLMTGALFKTNLGIKGMISGGFFGSLIGTVGGVAIISLLKLTGKSMKDIRAIQSKYIYARDEAFNTFEGVSQFHLRAICIMQFMWRHFFRLENTERARPFEILSTESSDWRFLCWLFKRIKRKWWWWIRERIK